MAAPLNIRDPQARALARELAELRRSSLTDAVVTALRAEIKRERSRIPLAEQLDKLADRMLAGASPDGRDVSEDERDAMWLR